METLETATTSPEYISTLPPQRSLFTRVSSALLRSPVGVGGALIVGFVLLLAVFGPWISPHEAVGHNLRSRFQNRPATATAPASMPWARTSWAAISSAASSPAAASPCWWAIVSVLIAGTIGVTYGLVSGFVGGLLDTVMMRIVDAILSIPFIVLVVAISGVVGAGLGTLILILGCTGLGDLCPRHPWRSAEKCARWSMSPPPMPLGQSRPLVMLRHVLPNVISSAIVLAAVQVAVTILAESSLSFLGLGVKTPTVTWGLMLADGKAYINSAWWMTTYPGMAITSHRAGRGLPGRLASRLPRSQYPRPRMMPYTKGPLHFLAMKYFSPYQSPALVSSPLSDASGRGPGEGLVFEFDRRLCHGTRVGQVFEFARRFWHGPGQGVGLYVRPPLLAWAGGGVGLYVHPPLLAWTGGGIESQPGGFRKDDPQLPHPPFAHNRDASRPARRVHGSHRTAGAQYLSAFGGDPRPAGSRLRSRKSRPATPSPSARARPPLFLALRACGIGPGDEVITIANSDISTSAAISNCGARIVALRMSWTATTPSTRTWSRRPSRRGPAPSCRWTCMATPANVKRLREIADRHGLLIVEDAALATGAYDHGSSGWRLCRCGRFQPGAIQALWQRGQRRHRRHQR